MYEFYLNFFVSRCVFNLSYDDIHAKHDSMKKIFCDVHMWDFKTSYVK